MRVWATISVLLALLAAAVYVAYVGWNLTDVTMPVTGYVAMVLGIVFSVILGAGLMALMFYSNRHGFDDAPSEFYTSRHGFDEPPSEPPKWPSRTRWIAEVSNPYPHPAFQGCCSRNMRENPRIGPFFLEVTVERWRDHLGCIRQPDCEASAKTLERSRAEEGRTWPLP